MSLDVILMKVMETEVFTQNITHNLNEMADAAGIYMHLWRPDEIGITFAGELIEPLENGLNWLRENSENCKEYEPSNGWGSYEGFLPWLEKYIEECRQHPDARVEVCR